MQRQARPRIIVAFVARTLHLADQMRSCFVHATRSH
jgi:hypothetical protein